MSRDYTPEEVQLRYVAAMGDHLGLVFYELLNECAHVHSRWRTFVTLFGMSEDRVNLLNEAAASFFGGLQDVLWEDVLLHLARLTDRPRIAGHETLTVRRLSDLAKDVPGIEAALDLVGSNIGFVRDWRDRHIAHRNLDLALERAKPLAAASRQSVSDALLSIAALLITVERHYCDGTPSAYDFGIDGHGDAEDLLMLLRTGLDARDAEWKQQSSNRR
ncbi:MAG TPA: hypothetical protein VJN96_03270 [Vicinamibacterales bacterium]|nr:hypothetical protein [Vicinamibacterales bacterium]